MVRNLIKTCNQKFILNCNQQKRKLKNKLQPAVFNSAVIIYGAKPEKPTAKRKINCNQQYLIHNAKPEKKTVFNLWCETEKHTVISSIQFKMRNLKKKLQPAVFILIKRNLKKKLHPPVFNLRCETRKTNCNQQYLFHNAKP